MYPREIRTINGKVMLCMITDILLEGTKDNFIIPMELVKNYKLKEETVTVLDLGMKAIFNYDLEVIADFIEDKLHMIISLNNYFVSIELDEESFAKALGQAASSKKSLSHTDYIEKMYKQLMFNLIEEAIDTNNHLIVAPFPVVTKCNVYEKDLLVGSANRVKFTYSNNIMMVLCEYIGKNLSSEYNEIRYEMFIGQKKIVMEEPEFNRISENAIAPINYVDSFTTTNYIEIQDINVNETELYINAVKQSKILNVLNKSGVSNADQFLSHLTTKNTTTALGRYYKTNKLKKSAVLISIDDYLLSELI
jgi:hypothetical protein